MARVISLDELLTRGVTRGEIYSYVENARELRSLLSAGEREKESFLLLIIRGGCYLGCSRENLVFFLMRN